MAYSQLIERPATPEDVAALVRRAREGSLPITVVSGGHGPWSRGDVDGMRIELGGLADIRVDGSTVQIGGGATWGAVAAALADAGLAISSGDTATVGVAGLTLGGGIGWMVRAWGLASDQLIGAQVVTASGEIVEASAEQNPDLFWALRGGGGNFGIVTRFDFRAHRLTGIAFAEYAIDGDAAAVLRATRDVMRDAPHELTVTYMDVPPMDPSAPAGARLSAVWAGEDAAALRSVLAPVEGMDGVVGTVSTPRYPEILLDPPQPPEGEQEPEMLALLGGNGLFADLDDELIARLIAFRAASPASVLFLRSLGGAFGEVEQESTAFPARGARWFMMAGAFDVPGMLDDRARASILADWQEIERGRLAEYGNFATTERPDAVPAMFTPAGYERVRQVKRAWDPQNVFRRNHNIVV